MRSIGIDLGTTTIKGAVLNLDTRALEHVTRQPFPDRVRRFERAARVVHGLPPRVMGRWSAAW